MRQSTRIVPNAPSTSLVNARIISTVSCKLVAVLIYNSNAGAQFIQIHESATAAAEGEAPKIPSIRVAGETTMMFLVADFGLDLDALYICNSSTANQKTIGAADCMISAVLAG